MLNRNVVSIDFYSMTMKVIEENETRWILLSDDDIETTKQSCLEMIIELKKLYNNDEKEVDESDGSVNDTYYDVNSKCLKSKRFIKKNSIIYSEEKPLVIAYDNDINTFNTNIKPFIIKTIYHINNTCDKDGVNAVMNFLIPSSHIVILSLFSKLSLIIQNEVLSLSSTPLEDIPNALKKALYFLADLIVNDDSKTNGFGLRSLLPDTIVRLILIFSSNVFGSQSQNDEFSFIALYRYGCRINHSCCNSNAHWVINTNNGNLTFISTRDISIGDEVTQCYFDRERWYSTQLRKEFLKESRYFSCQCIDCSSSKDYHRNFCCSQCHGLGSLIVTGVSDMQCIKCDYIPNKDETLRLFKEEDNWQKLAVSLAINADSCKHKELEDCYESMKQYAPLHWSNCEITDYLSSLSFTDIKKVGLIYRRIVTLNYNSKSVTNIAIGAIISLIDITQDLLAKVTLSSIDVKNFTKNEMNFILSVKNITYKSCDDYDNHYLVFYLLISIALQSLFITEN